MYPFKVILYAQDRKQGCPAYNPDYSKGLVPPNVIYLDIFTTHVFLSQWCLERCIFNIPSTELSASQQYNHIEQTSPGQSTLY